MKKTLTVIALLAGAVAGYSQGTFYFYNSGVEGTPAITLHAPTYGAQLGTYSVTYGGYTVLEQLGQASTGTPTGNTVYAAPALGGSTTTGSLYDAQILAAAGSSDTLAQLSPLGTIVNYNTVAAGAGYAKGPNVETLGSGTTATIAIAAWAINAGGAGGAANTLVEAQADLAEYGNASGYAWGISDLVTVNLASGSTPTTPMPSSMESFSLGLAVPEPSTIALGVIGASALLFRRRK